VLLSLAQAAELLFSLRRFANYLVEDFANHPGRETVSLRLKNLRNAILWSFTPQSKSVIAGEASLTIQVTTLGEGPEMKV
jgi:hypothetical protein